MDDLDRRVKHAEETLSLGSGSGGGKDINCLIVYEQSELDENDELRTVPVSFQPEDVVVIRDTVTAGGAHHRLAKLRQDCSAEELQMAADWSVPKSLQRSRKKRLILLAPNRFPAGNSGGIART